jgi:hypothetical protein|nr:MAG TPA: hypothetical protein [Caudoviricetes sp.]
MNNSPKSNSFQTFIYINRKIIDCTQNTVFPIKLSKILDEQLDEASIALLRTKTPVIHPLTKIVIRIWNNDFPGRDITLNMLVTSDYSEEKIVGERRWNHRLMLIEETKFLEGFICRSQGYVNSLGRIYTNAKNEVKPALEKTGGIGSIPEIQQSIYTPLLVGENSFPSLQSLFTWKATVSSYTVVIQNGVEIKREKDVDTPIVVDLTNGTVELIYHFDLLNSTGQLTVNGTATYLVNIASNVEPSPKWNARSVIERALMIAEPLRKGDTPKFHLNADQAKEFEKIETPEFQFTQSTLREILQGVGAYIHGEPRLNGDEIYYDMYGSGALNDVHYKNYAALSMRQDIEQYASGIDSSVDNFVNTVGRDSGVIIEPYDGGYKTLRTETLYARVEEGNMLISTQWPIYSISKVECGFVGETTSADITPYIFESADYARMSSYSELYPESRAYALYYTIGEKNIYGLNFKEAHPISPAFKNYAILNILRAATGDSSLTIDEGKENGEDGYTEGGYPLLAFRVTYTPIFSARVQQSKAYIGELTAPRTLAYNQAQNVVEASYYGERMKGAIARMGNVEKTYTFVFAGLARIPKVGDLFDDDYYISTVDVEIQPESTKITLGLSQDFNRYSEFIGINTAKRVYEVSERQAYDSNLSYRDYVVIGDKVGSENTLFDISRIATTFSQNFETEPITLAIAQGEDDSENLLAEIALPVQTAAFGNAAVMTFKYEDNYSAGNNVTWREQNNVQGWFTNGVAYSDVHGNMEYLHLKYYEGGTIPATKEQQTQIGTSLPNATNITGRGQAYINTGERPLWVKKGSTEILSVTYQIDYVSNRKNIIIGSALAKNCVFVSGSQSGHGAVLYVLPQRLNKFRLKADLNGATQIYDYNGNSDGFYLIDGGIQFKPCKSPVNGQSWVMTDKETGEVLIGCNRQITPQDEDILDGLFIAGKHDIFL